MFKIFTVALLLISSQSLFAEETLNHLTPTHQLVKAKLWFEGIEPVQEKTGTYKEKKQVRELPEELSVALEQLES